MMFLIRFWRKLTNKDSVESVKYDITIYFTSTQFFKFFPLDPDFSDWIPIFVQSGSGLRKKVQSKSGKTPGSETLHYPSVKDSEEIIPDPDPTHII